MVGVDSDADLELGITVCRHVKGAKIEMSG